MVGWRKNCFSSVFTFKHPGGMGHANQKHRVFASLAHGVVQRATGMLLEHAVNVLQACDIALANAIHAFVEPADRRAEGNSVVTNLPTSLQSFERRPKRIVISLPHPDIVEL